MMKQKRRPRKKSVRKRTDRADIGRFPKRDEKREREARNVNEQYWCCSREEDDNDNDNNDRQQKLSNDVMKDKDKPIAAEAVGSRPMGRED
jgi:hypothetical protein